MWQNHLKIALRNIKKQKLYALVNIGGLSIGLATFILIVLYIQDELSYDSFHTKSHRVVLFQQFEKNAGSGSGFAQLLRSELPQVEQTARLVKLRSLISNSQQAHFEDNFYFSDNSVFNLFDFTLLQGNQMTALKDVNSIVISQKTAQKYFGNSNVIGKTLKYNNKQDFVITGVMQNLPYNSHLKIDILASFKNAEKLTEQNLQGYWDNMSLTYLLLNEKASLKASFDHLVRVIEKTQDPNRGVWKPNLIPVNQIYLYHQLDGRLTAVKAIDNVYIFMAIAVLVLILATFNYVNLTTARSTIRAKEVGLRKVLGAQKLELFKQFLSESFLITFLASLLAILWIELSLSWFNQLTDKSLSNYYLLNPLAILIFIVGIVILSVFNGIYPAFVLTSYKPIEVLKDQTKKGGSLKINLRKVLVVGQFSTSIVISIVTFVVITQLQYIQNKKIGYERSQILTLNLAGNMNPSQAQAFKNSLSAITGIKNLTYSNMLPGQGILGNKLVEKYVPKGKDLAYGFTTGDEDFLNTFEIKLLQGKFFDKNTLPNQNKFVINQTMVKHLEWKDSPIGKKLGYYTYAYKPEGGYQEIPITGEVIGVFEDYHQLDLKKKIQPMILFYSDEGRKLAIKLQSGDIKSSISKIEGMWKKFFNNQPFEYTFLDVEFDKLYLNEQKVSQVFSVFAFLSFFISGLGLFSLATFSIERRIKEIGIRKVLGASVSQIVGLISKDFLRLVVIAIVIASPIAYYIASKWLENFAYRTPIHWWIFGLAGFLAVLIALFTVGFQAIRAGQKNPVESLKYE
jgi:putative ABC transport system permease protein